MSDKGEVYLTRKIAFNWGQIVKLGFEKMSMIRDKYGNHPNYDEIDWSILVF